MKGCSLAEYRRMRQSAHSVVYPKVKGVNGPIPIVLLRDGAVCPLAYAFFCEPEQRRCSYSKKKKMAIAIGLLYDFYVFNYELATLRATDNLLEEFADALLHGTIDLNGEDCSGLFIPPLGAQDYNSYRRFVAGFAKFCIDYFDVKGIEECSQRYFELIKKSFVAELSKYHSKYSFLGHLRGYGGKPDSNFRSNSALGRNRLAKFGIGTLGRTEYQFPADKVMSLIYDGTKRARKKSDSYWDVYQVREQLSLLLMFFCGLRESELAHLFVEDIRYNHKSERVQVVLGHPSEGLVLYKGKKIKRIDYLRDAFGRLPRTMLSGSRHAGWKNLLLLDGENKQTFGFWLHGAAADAFWGLHKIYIERVRPRATQSPYYFVNLKGPEKGEPLSIKKIQQQWSACCKRIGLVERKEYGTTPHGARGFYSKVLEGSGADRVTIQTALHHANPMSQDAYLKNSVGRISEFLNKAETRIAEGLSLGGFNVASLNIHSSLDPLGYFRDDRKLR